VGCCPGSIILRLGGVTSGLSLPETCGCNYGAEHLKFFHAFRLRSRRLDFDPDSIPLPPIRSGKKRRGTEKSVPRSLPSGLVGQLLLSLASLDRRPPRDASPPFLPAILASSLVNSCAVPFWWAARPPFAAIARCAWGSIAANPRGVLRLTPPVLRVSAPLSPLVPLLPPPTPLLRTLRSSILSPLLSAWSAIIHLLPRYSSLSVVAGGHPSCQRVDCPVADRV
jgi:hypothetical protein